MYNRTKEMRFVSKPTTSKLSFFLVQRISLGILNNFMPDPTVVGVERGSGEKCIISRKRDADVFIGRENVKLICELTKGISNYIYFTY